VRNEPLFFIPMAALVALGSLALCPAPSDAQRSNATLWYRARTSLFVPSGSDEGSWQRARPDSTVTLHGHRVLFDVTPVLASVSVVDGDRRVGAMVGCNDRARARHAMLVSASQPSGSDRSEVELVVEIYCGDRAPTE